MEKYLEATSKMWIKKIHIQNCLCFNDTWVPSVGEFGQINCFIGRNDRGKSLVLKIFDILFKGITSSFFEGLTNGGSTRSLNLNPMGITLINGNKPGKANISIHINITQDEVENIFIKIPEKFRRYFPINEEFVIEYVIDYPDETSGHFYIKAIKNEKIEIDVINNHLIQNGKELRITGASASDWTNMINHYINGLLDLLGKAGFLLIPADKRIEREIAQNVNQSWNPKTNGAGIANALFEFQNRPTLGKRGIITQIQQDITKFSEFSDVSAIADQNLRDIEFDKIPQRFVGDATKQMTVTFFNIRNFKTKIVGYEEPESHLHPGRQKQLIKNLKDVAEKNKVQFFITTHSPFIIDQLNLENIYHFKKTEKGIQAERVETDEALWNLLNEIGIRPHDFLQSDIIIFTEGASDRMILKIFAEKLGFNIDELNITLHDFSGDLANRDVESLLKINRNFRVILCSHAGIPQAEKEIEKFRDKFREAGQISKLTILRKREIENYLSGRAISQYFGIDPSILTIEDDTDVITKVEELSEKNWKKSKTKIGPRIANIMKPEEIDGEIKELFKKIEQDLSEVYE